METHDDREKGKTHTGRPSRLNMGGMGRWMFKLMMKQKGVTQLPELRDAAIALGVQLLPCQMSMDVMEITCDDFIPEVANLSASPPCWNMQENPAFNFLFSPHPAPLSFALSGRDCVLQSRRRSVRRGSKRN
jgi:hypothetical protein